MEGPHPTARKSHQHAASSAVFTGRPAPSPIQMPWPDRLHDAASAYRTHQSAFGSAGPRPQPAPGEDARPPLGLLLSVSYDRLVHELFGLIGHALDIDLHDHADLAADVRALYAEAGPASPRANE